MSAIEPREQQREERDLEIDLAFAQLEIIELQAGYRTLTDCPGLRALGQRVAAADAARAAKEHA